MYEKCKQIRKSMHPFGHKFTLVIKKNLPKQLNTFCTCNAAKKK